MKPSAETPERKWLPRTPSLSQPESGLCQICGMEDGNRFKLGVGTASWNGYPVHDACEQWISTNPDGSKREQASRPAEPAPSFAPALPPPGPAPHDVMLRFPGITAEEIQFARNVQRHGRPILVTRARPGDTKLLFYGLPEIPKYLILDAGGAIDVAGGGPLDGGYTLVMLRHALTIGLSAGMLATPTSKEPHQQACGCNECALARLERMTWSAFMVPPPQVAE